MDKLDDMSQTDQLLKDLNISPVKKERVNKQSKQVLRLKLRADLPVLSVKEIRRFRLPHHEAALIELTETGYSHTAEFIKQLLDYQEKIRQKYGPGTVVWSRPQLIKSKEHFDALLKRLAKAERAHKAEDYGTEWDEMLHSAAHYAFGSDDWWWLGEQLLYQCVSMQYPGDFRKQEAIANFMIGKYLVENGKKPDSGKYYLEVAREMSIGKSWGCRRILEKAQGTVFTESCRLLFKTLTEEAAATMKYDPESASEICTIARKRAAEACDHEGEFSALLLKGKCDMLLQNSTGAIATVARALHRSTRRQSVKEICEASINLAMAYLLHGKTQSCMDHLKDVKTIAEANNIPFFVGQAYRYMGEYYLSRDEAYEATPMLMLAFYIFNDAADLGKREEVRTWGAISAGEELFPAFINLIKSCDNTEQGRESLTKLIKWIDEREFFWTQQSKFSFSYDLLRESVSEIKGVGEIVTQKIHFK